ncbi:Trimethyllysine dioxygenase, mitochondrial [Aphelenchoides bicaudatus]|nr:Trimethyllysine dioxygenase, mitochondrial [Aphelenchoides bicaudatus]
MFARSICRFFGTTTRINQTAINSQFAIQSGAVCSAKLVTESNPKFNSVELELDEAEILRIPLVWLRDHCRDHSNFNWETNQRISNGINFFEKSVLASSGDAMDFDRQNQILSLRWQDGHQSVYHTKELLEWSVFKSRDYDYCASRTYWNKQTMREIPSISSRNFDFIVFSRLFLRFGVVAVTGNSYLNSWINFKLQASTPETKKQPSTCVKKYHRSRKRYTETFWVFGNDLGDKNSNTYKSLSHNKALTDLHNDGAYLEQSPGVQVFHCLRLPETSSDIRLVDGFNVAQLLRHERPELFDTLATTQIEHHYMETLKQEENHENGDFFEEPVTEKHTSPKPLLKFHARSITKPVVECFKHKIVQIRFNPYDRAPLRTLRVVEFDEENARANVAFYEAYERFSQIVHNQNSAIELTLKPGTVIFIDNTRVLHSFKEFKVSCFDCNC